MNSKLKLSIKRAFDNPIPNRQKKEHFLKTLPQPQISMGQLILTQAGYLRKSTIVISALLVLPVRIGAYYIDMETLWIASAIIPFMAFLAVAESARSMTYGMSELEMSTRFSLKSVVLARMSFLGLLDFFLVFILALLCRNERSVPIFQTAVYLFVPYLLTVNISLWITRHFYEGETIYVCMGVAVLIGGSNMGLHFKADFIYQSSYIVWWIILSVILIGATAHEIYKTIKQTEEYTWNLSLTD